MHLHGCHEEILVYIKIDDVLRIEIHIGEDWMTFGLS